MAATEDTLDSVLGMRYADHSVPRRYLIASDPHCFEEEINRYSNSHVVEALKAIGDVYECHELVLPGDIGKFEDLERFLDGRFEVVKAVSGNHDPWEGERGVERRDDKTLAYDESFEWADDSSHGFKIGMVHEPTELGFHALEPRSSNEDLEDYDIVLHGHSHVVNIRRLNDETIGVSSGSVQRECNYNRCADLPDRSAIVMEIDGVVDFKQIDFDHYASHSSSGKGSPVVEHVTYEHGPEGFEKIRHDTAWDGEIKFVTG